ncbi:DNA methylase [Vreelandella aquamarina]|uniref:DNA methyltransferase n=1 Tax=Vreelandella aquamarina TaxID=77097 RepID=UPI00384C7A83
MNQLFDHLGEVSGPVECLGQTFPSDDARREHFLKLLAEKMKDPDFRRQDGFPEGTDEAILEMSDPPFYTACPNPWLQDFIDQYGKPYDPSVKYSREPLAIDVSVGKTDAIYRAHSYHTKVPHLAIVPSILHYTEPGDVILDGFAGSGMTGVATQWCGTAPANYRHELEVEWKRQGRPTPKWGSRRAVLNDLSPAATFISANLGAPFDVDAFARAGEQLLKDVEQEIGWMYETLHSDGKTAARIDYTVWSEVLSCPECAGEIVFTDAALDQETKSVASVLSCPHCGAQGKKEQLDLLFETFIDPATGQTEKRPKRVPALIFYKLGKTVYSKTPDETDLERINKIATLPTPKNLPLDSFPDCQMTRVGRMKTTNSSAIHFMFLPRAAQAMALLWNKASSISDKRVRDMMIFMVEQAIWTSSVLNRYRPTGYSQVNQFMTGVFYVASQSTECSPWYILNGKLDRLIKTFQSFQPLRNAVTTTGTAHNLSLPDSSVDYIFTDPPFGENIYYSDLNFLVEAWHGVKTDPNPEAIVDRVRQKGIPEYQHLMYKCFGEYNRVLKPGRWMTVVFSNSKAAVWNTIQVALQQTGFVVAEVSALDKKQGSFQQVMSPNTVKQDLVISVYKPNGGLEDRFEKNGATTDSVWDFVHTHLGNLSVVKPKAGELDFIVERDARRIFDRMVAWFVRHNAPVPLSNDEFLSGIRNRFPERDGMIFLPEQVAEYDKKRAQVAQAPQIELFVSDERSAIDWLTDFLRKRPSTYQETHPEFTTQVGAGWKKHEAKPELKALLEDNFLKYDGNGEVPSQIHSYLSTNHKDLRGLGKDDARLIAKAKDRWYVPDPNKAQDLEKKREKALLKEFENYKSFSGPKIKESRLEVLRAGFRNAWANKDYETILKIAGKLPDTTLQEDEKLLTFFDMAVTRVEGDL